MQDADRLLPAGVFLNHEQDRDLILLEQGQRIVDKGIRIDRLGVDGHELRRRMLLYEKDEALRAIYRESLERSWQVERAERNPLWNFIYAAGTGAKEFDLDASMRTLEEIPLDLISWSVTNSHRLDVTLDPSSDRFGRRQSALIVLPYDELPMMKWNGSPYRLDGGNGGRSEDDGAYFLLPYWMGRYHDFIKD